MSVNEKRLIGFLFFLQTLFLASTFGSWLPVCAAAMIAGTVVFLRHRRVASDAHPSPVRLARWYYLARLFATFTGIVALTAAWRLSQQSGESINPIYVGVDVLAHAALFSSLVVWVMKPDRGHVSMLPLGLVLMLLCVAAGGTSQSLAAQSTIALAACLGFSLGSQIILAAAGGARGTFLLSEPSIDGKSSRIGPLFTLLALSILMMATSAIANATSVVLPGIQERLQQQLQASFEAVGEQIYVGGTRYVRGSTLGEIRSHMLGDPQEVALRIDCDVSPGYLRGHAFDHYERSRWSVAGSGNRSQTASERSVVPSGEGRVTLKQPRRQPLQRFPLVEPAAGEATIHLEIHNDPLKGLMVFMPLTTSWLEAYSREIVVTDHGIVRLGVDVTRPYVAGVARSVRKEQLDPQRRRMLLDVPPSVSTETNRIANQVCASLPTAPLKAAAVSRLFQRDFLYSMAPVNRPRGVDPVNYFLQTRHGAHCEYFASATVLVLRSAGVPTRYVTGYVCDEFSDEDSVWLARNRDAHAWAEAYDDSTGLWFPVESTPGRSYRTVDPSDGDQANESFFDVFRRDVDDDNDSILGRVIGWLLSMRATDPLLLVFRFAQLPLFCVVAFLLWSRYLKPTASAVDPIDQQSRKMLRIADRRLRRYSLVRRPSETLFQFADRIDAHRAQDRAPSRGEVTKLLSDVSGWYRDYAAARYQGELPVPFANDGNRVDHQIDRAPLGQVIVSR